MGLARRFRGEQVNQAPLLTYEFNAGNGISLHFTIPIWEDHARASYTSKYLDGSIFVYYTEETDFHVPNSGSLEHG